MELLIYLNLDFKVIYISEVITFFLGDATFSYIFPTLFLWTEHRETQNIKC